MNKIQDFLNNIFIFKTLNKEEIARLIQANELESCSFRRGDCIFSKNRNEKKMGFIFSGKAEVRKPKNDGNYSVLNQLIEGDSFGVLSVFSEEEFPTEIYALKNSQVIFISEAKIKELIIEYPKISENIIKFMAERIIFLNRKIRTFSGTYAEDRLFSYLLGKWEDNERREFTLNFKKCSDAINAGRASVYRAVSSLEEEGVISTNGKLIKLLKTERN